MNCNIERLIW